MIAFLMGIVVGMVLGAYGWPRLWPKVKAWGHRNLPSIFGTAALLLMATSLHGQATRDSVVCSKCIDSLVVPHTDSAIVRVDTIYRIFSWADTLRRDSLIQVPIPPDTTHPPLAGHPNEPKGYGFSRSLSGTAIPKGQPAPYQPGYTGNCYGMPSGNLSVQGGAIQTRFPAGMVAGVGPANYGCYDFQNRELSAVYFSAWVQIVGPDYENQRSGTKLGFFASGRAMAGENENFPFLVNSAATQGLQSAFPMEIRQQGIPQANGSVNRNLTQNVDKRMLMTAGSWHHWEIVLTLNAMGQANGTARFWIDGIKVLDYSNVIWRTATAPKGFSLWKWNPTWGGSGGTRTRADFIQLRDIYLSGLP